MPLAVLRNQGVASHLGTESWPSTCSSFPVCAQAWRYIRERIGEAKVKAGLTITVLALVSVISAVTLHPTSVPRHRTAYVEPALGSHPSQKLPVIATASDAAAVARAVERVRGQVTSHLRLIRLWSRPSPPRSYGRSPQIATSYPPCTANRSVLRMAGPGQAVGPGPAVRAPPRPRYPQPCGSTTMARCRCDSGPHSGLQPARLAKFWIAGHKPLQLRYSWIEHTRHREEMTT